jgi:hypothetical protein
MKTAGRNWKPPMSDAEREAKLTQLGVAIGARWAWTDADIRKTLRKSPAKRAAEKRQADRAGWDRLIGKTQEMHSLDLETACLVWLDQDDLAQLARVGIGGFGEKLTTTETEQALRAWEGSR